MNLKDFCLWNNRMRGYVQYPWYQYVSEQKHAVSIPSLIERYGNAKNIRANLGFMERDGLLIRTSQPGKKIFVRANTAMVETFDTIGCFEQDAPIYLLADNAKWIETEPLKFLEIAKVGFRLDDFDLSAVRKSQVKAGLTESGLLEYNEETKQFSDWFYLQTALELIADLEKLMKG